MRSRDKKVDRFFGVTLLTWMLYFWGIFVMLLGVIESFSNDNELTLIVGGSFGLLMFVAAQFVEWMARHDD